MTISDIKRTYRLTDEIRSRGITINRQGFCNCPFHNGDNTASLKVYPEQNTWHCFGCDQGGDIIDFVRLADGLSFQEACKRISGEDLTKEKAFTIDRKKLERDSNDRTRRRLKKNLHYLEDKICEYWWQLKSDEPLSDEFANDIFQWQLLNYKADSIMEQLEHI